MGDEVIQGSGRYATMSMHKSDLVRFMEFPEAVYAGAEKVLLASWPPGIKSERVYAGAYEYKLNGRPWGGMGRTESMGSRVLLRDLLRYLYEAGWVVVAPISVSESQGGKDNLLFRNARYIDAGAASSSSVSLSASSPSSPLLARRPTATAAPAPARWLAVQFSFRRTLALHGVGGDPELVQDVRRVLERLDMHDKGEWNGDAFEFCLRGTPWFSAGEKTMKTRRLLTALLEVLEDRGWASYCTVRQRTDSDGVRVCDSWYLINTAAGAAAGRVSSSSASSS